MSNCPKCNEKLSPFYFKQTCPKCGANLLYYNLEENLKQDAQIADKEWGAVDTLLNGIKVSAVGSPIAILRTLSYFVSVVLLLIPCYVVTELPIEKVSLLSLIKMLVSGDLQFGTILSDKTLLLCFAAFVSVVLIGLVSLILSLFSYTKNGFKRNVALTIIDIAVFLVITLVINFSAGVSISVIGCLLVMASMFLTLALHKFVDKKIDAD